MKLSRLEIFGFKSFLNRTVFQFGHGVTSIVGPNGCGKSNIVDAIVWVLGERGTKSLRVKDMGDVIFHGSNGRRPVNIAEVTLELSDGDKELAVKRRIYRDGVNEYFLNGNPVRLKDVQEAFLGTGVGLNAYAIIEQGRIETFISMKPLERRVIIEEASGITRFEEKKREALARMEEVTGNLERVDDIHREVTAAFEKTKVEWERWKAYRVLADKLHDIDKDILLDGWGKLNKRIGKIRERQGELDAEIVKKEAQKAEQKEQFDAKESEFTLTDNIVRQLEVDIKGKEKDMESRLIEIEYVREEKQRLEAQCNTQKENETRIESQIDAHKSQIEALSEKTVVQKEELSREESAETALREQTEALKAAIGGHEKKAEEERNALFVTMSKLTEIKNRIIQIERSEKERQARLEKEAAEKTSLKDTLTKQEAQHRTLKENLEAQRVEKNSIYGRETRSLDEREKARKSVEEERAAVESAKSERRIKEDFLKQLGGYIDDAQQQGAKTEKLMDMIRVEEAREKALERFFSDELEFSVITGDDTDAVAKTVGSRGNFIFFPQKGIFKRSGPEIEVDIKWISSIDEALKRIESGEEGIFMNDDVCVDSRGMIHSGEGKKKVDLRQFKEKLKLEKEIKALAGALKDRQAALEAAQKLYVSCDSSYQVLRKEREEQERIISRMEKDIYFIEAQIKTGQERLYVLDGRIDLTEDTSLGEIERLSEERQKGEQEKIDREAAMAALKAEMDGAKKEFEEARSKWHAATINIERKKNGLKALEEEKERARTAIVRLSEEIKTGQDRLLQTQRHIAERAAKIEKLENDYGSLKKDSEKELERYEELKKMLGNLHVEKQGFQESIEATGKEIERIKSRRENTDKDIAVFEEKQAVILERLKTTYEIENPAEMEVQLNAGIEQERETIAGEIAEMGEINFRAEKEYQELEERIVFLEKQKEDLGNAMESLKKTITKIDGLTREMFAETFEKVNSAFIRFTDQLFKGGKGQLMVNQENGGIEMFVQPPGKKTLRMEMLSGGEKALICLALLLALMDTRPSPFALMDEIDAPLDDANLMGLLEIMKYMSAKTQIIFITHNRITMEGSDAIYGITMEEQGISKTVSVKL